MPPCALSIVLKQVLISLNGRHHHHLPVSSNIQFLKNYPQKTEIHLTRIQMLDFSLFVHSLFPASTSVLSETAASSHQAVIQIHMQVKLNENFSSSVAPDTFQVPKSHVRLVTTVSKNLENNTQKGLPDKAAKLSEWHVK